MKHTEGPWDVAFDTDKHILVGCKERGICIVPNEGGADEPIKVANARLIAAAPEMFEALETMVEMVEMNGFIRDYAMEIAREAIRKARGEE